MSTSDSVSSREAQNKNSRQRYDTDEDYRQGKLSENSRYQSENKVRIRENNRKRYNSDPEYRRRRLKASAAYYQRKKESK